MSKYLKGKDIKQKGDCLVYCYTRRIEILATSDAGGYSNFDYRYQEQKYKIPEGFEKW